MEYYEKINCDDFGYFVYFCIDMKYGECWCSEEMRDGMIWFKRRWGFIFKLKGKVNLKIKGLELERKSVLVEVKKRSDRKLNRR